MVLAWPTDIWQLPLSDDVPLPGSAAGAVTWPPVSPPDEEEGGTDGLPPTSIGSAPRGGIDPLPVVPLPASLTLLPALPKPLP